MISIAAFGHIKTGFLLIIVVHFEISSRLVSPGILTSKDGLLLPVGAASPSAVVMASATATP